MSIQRDGIVDGLWRRRLVWSRVADKCKTALNRARLAQLALGVGGAVLETLAATALDGAGHAHTLVATTGAVLLAMIPVIRLNFLKPEHTSAWIRARSASEGIKSEVYQFCAGAAPYDQAESIRALVDACRRIEQNVHDLEHYVAAEPEVTGAAPPALPGDAYVNQRVRQQIDGYYRKKAREAARYARSLRWAEIALALLSALFGALAATPGSMAPAGTWQAQFGAWTAVLTTIGGALTTHAAANRYDFLAISYSATARRLEELLDDWTLSGASTHGAAWSDFVIQCEGAISVENESWLAKWAQPLQNGVPDKH